MKKIKVALNAIAILAAVGGAFATRYCKQCEEHAQYVPVKDTYLKVGEYGTDYNCSFNPGICTYYTADSTHKAAEWLPCREGLYTPVSD